ncbi:hypothetical protein OH779_37650 [Actinacidiphila glaucinigra]|uniref:hypothetical protein n=1 Tax=Actinacidiphila glaucinigra TaxID=235986 RepID=UPI00386C3CDA
MKSEPHDTSGPGRRRPGQAAALPAWLTVIGLMVMGVLALLPDVSLLPVGTALIAGGGVVGSDRERPRRWVPAAAAGICVVAAPATLGATVARLVSPPAADLGPHVGIILGFPPAAAVFTWVGNLGNPPAPPAAAGPDA